MVAHALKDRRPRQRLLDLELRVHDGSRRGCSMVDSVGDPSPSTEFTCSTEGNFEWNKKERSSRQGRTDYLLCFLGLTALAPHPGRSVDVHRHQRQFG